MQKREKPVGNDKPAGFLQKPIKYMARLKIKNKGESLKKRNFRQPRNKGHSK